MQLGKNTGHNFEKYENREWIVWTVCRKADNRLDFKTSPDFCPHNCHTFLTRKSGEVVVQAFSKKWYSHFFDSLSCVKWQQIRPEKPTFLFIASLTADGRGDNIVTQSNIDKGCDEDGRYVMFSESWRLVQANKTYLKL